MVLLAMLTRLLKHQGEDSEHGGLWTVPLTVHPCVATGNKEQVVLTYITMVSSGHAQEDP